MSNRKRCYPNGTYFWDTRLKGSRLNCRINLATLSGGEWIGPAGKLPCPGKTSNLHCSYYSGFAPIRISLYISIYSGAALYQSGDGWYKCCLPTACSDPNTNIIFVNVFSKRSIITYYTS